MDGDRTAARRATARRLLLAVALLAHAAVGAAQPGDAAAGARLFTGQARFANGGPACATCHDAAGLPFPGGGTMGPSLTDASSTFGAEPLQLMLKTLFFPTMAPVFSNRPLTPGERADLGAFLAASAARAPPRGATLATFGLAVLASLALATAIGLLGRRRLRGVRAPLVRAATARLRGARR